MAKQKKNRRALKGREQALLCGLAIVGFLLIADLLFLRPFLKELERMSEESRMASLELRRQTATLRTRDAVAAEWAALRPRILMEASREVEMSAMQADVDQWEEASGVQLLGTKMRDAEPHGKLEVFVLDATVEGRMPSVMHFLHLLQQDERLYQVRSFSLGPKGKDGSGVLKGNLEITKVLARE